MLNQDRASKELQQFRLQTDCTSTADRQFLSLFERKYEQIMSFTESDIHGGRLDTAAVCALLAPGGKRNWSPGDGEGAFHSYKRSKCCEQIVKSSSSPGSNNSEVTTEQYMAESSKSSCFDDACTLAVETGVAGAAATTTGAAAGGESGASTSELVQSYRKNNEELDLNGIPYGQACLSDKRASETATTNFNIAEETSRQHRLVSLVKAEEDEGEGSMLLLSNNKRAQTGKGIEYYSSQDSSWLQLGLGPSSRSPNVPQMARPQVEYATTEEDEADVSRQQKPVLHLFPSESVQISQYSSQRMPTTQQLGAARSGGVVAAAEVSDLYSGGPYVPPLRFARTVAAAAADIETQPREVGSREDFTGFLKPIKEAPDTQLVISYGNTVTAPYGHAAPGTDRLSEAAALAQRGSNSRLMSMLGESYQPQGYHEGTGAMISEAPLHHSYAYDSGFQGSQSYEDKHFQSRSFGGTTGHAGVGSLGKGMQQQQQDISSSWKHESFHPFAPSRPAAGVYLPMAAPFHTGPRNLMQPNQPPEDWQTLIKRLGGSIQFQSLFPSMPKAGEGIEELQQRRSNLRDLQAQWNSQQEGRPSAATAGSWSRHQILGTGSGAQDMSVKTMPAFSFPSFEGSLSSRLSPPPPPGLQAWQPSASLLPFLPVSQHHQLIAAETSSRERRRLSPVKDHDVWFFLRAGRNQDSEQLPQIPKGYLRVKDGTVPVSHVKKYLVHKLGLMCESEVEISCRGQILLPSLSLQHVRDVIWYSSAAVCSAAVTTATHHTGDHEEQDTSTSTTTTTTTNTVTTTAAPRNIVMELNYRRRHPQFGGASS